MIFITEKIVFKNYIQAMNRKTVVTYRISTPNMSEYLIKCCTKFAHFSQPIQLKTGRTYRQRGTY